MELPADETVQERKRSDTASRSQEKADAPDDRPHFYFTPGEAIAALPERQA